MRLCVCHVPRCCRLPATAAAVVMEWLAQAADGPKLHRFRAARGLIEVLPWGVMSASCGLSHGTIRCTTSRTPSARAWPWCNGHWHPWSALWRARYVCYWFAWPLRRLSKPTWPLRCFPVDANTHEYATVASNRCAQIAKLHIDERDNSWEDRSNVLDTAVYLVRFAASSTVGRRC